jgi:DNA anti-recombination protein RmuC
MSNALIQQSLIDIEQNLRKLESARNQVGGVAEKTERLIESISSVISNIESIREAFEGEESYLKKGVQNSLDAFKKDLEKSSEVALKKASALSEKQDKIISETILKLEDFQSKLRDVQKSLLDFDLEKSLDGIRGEISKLIEEVNSNQKKNSDILDEIKSEIKANQEIVAKNAKQNLLVLAVGFVLVIVVIFITK